MFLKVLIKVPKGR